MSKLKGKKELNSAILKELKPFGIENVKLSDKYTYTQGKNKITYTLELPLEYQWLIEFIADRFNYICHCHDSFILLFLHEIGHHNTIDFISGGVQKFCDEEKIRIANEMLVAETEEEQKRLEFQYFGLPDELMATQWAVNYARKHPLKVKNITKRIIDSFQTFYNINGVTED